MLHWNRIYPSVYDKLSMRFDGINEMVETLFKSVVYEVTYLLSLEVFMRFLIEIFERAKRVKCLHCNTLFI